MDTSETYIKMCEKAKRYLPVVEPQVGQLWATEGFKGWEVEIICDGEEWQEPYLRPWADYINDEVEGFDYKSLIAKSFPVYAQDQLQEMFGVKWTLPWLARNLWGFYQHNFHLHSVYDREGYYPGEWEPASMEQLWLAFYMHQHYKKVWNGEEWVVK